MDRGLSRSELTYTVYNKKMQDELFGEGFINKASQDLELALIALNGVSGIGWHIPNIQLFSLWEKLSKEHQLFILQPCVSGLFYTANEKAACFTGHYKDTQQKHYFQYYEYLKT